MQQNLNAHEHDAGVDCMSFNVSWVLPGRTHNLLLSDTVKAYNRAIHGIHCQLTCAPSQLLVVLALLQCTDPKQHDSCACAGPENSPYHGGTFLVDIELKIGRAHV